MTHILPVRPLQSSEISDRTFTLNLILSAPNSVAVRSCEVIGRGFRNRTSFIELPDIADVLHERLASGVHGCLQDIPDKAQVVSFPEFLIELPGLALSGVHIMVMDVRNGVRNAIFRFSEFIGSIHQVFRQNIGVEEPCLTYADRLAVNVLADVCLPIINLARASEFAHREAGREMPQQLADMTREFEFQLELLKRFVSNARSDAESAQADQIDVERRQRLLFGS